MGGWVCARASYVLDRASAGRHAGAATWQCSRGRARDRASARRPPSQGGRAGSLLRAAAAAVGCVGKWLALGVAARSTHREELAVRLLTHDVRDALPQARGHTGIEEQKSGGARRARGAARVSDDNSPSRCRDRQDSPHARRGHGGKHARRGRMRVQRAVALVARGRAVPRASTRRQGLPAKGRKGCKQGVRGGAHLHAAEAPRRVLGPHGVDDQPRAHVAQQLLRRLVRARGPQGSLARPAGRGGRGGEQRAPRRAGGEAGWG